MSKILRQGHQELYQFALDQANRENSLSKKISLFDLNDYGD